jgi:hypothetical protein
MQCSGPCKKLRRAKVADRTAAIGARRGVKCVRTRGAYE